MYFRTLGKSLPETANLVKLAGVLDSSLDWLLTGEGPTSRKDPFLYAADRNSRLTQDRLEEIIAKQIQKAIREELSKHPLRDEE